MKYKSIYISAIVKLAYFITFLETLICGERVRQDVGFSVQT